MSVIVADANGPISGEGFVSISLESVIDGPQFQDLREWLLSELSKSGKASFSSPLNLCHTLVETLTTKGGELGAHRGTEVRAAIGKLQSAVVRTQDNTISYLASGRARPQTVFWPDPTLPNGRTIYRELPYARTNKIIDRSTPVGSAGSCFAMEIANYLKEKEFNYIVTEENKISCAKWGIIFNTSSFRDLVQVAFGVKKRQKLLWGRKDSLGGIQYLDPFREDILFSSVEEYEEDYDRHLKNAREALATCKVFVLTLGMNEVWTLTSDGTALSRAPWCLAPHLVQHQVLTVSQNVDALQTMLDTWRVHNPDLQLIVTVSPVPLHATFRGDDHHVIAANQHSKSTLRVAAEEFCTRNPGRVTYFPSYETVLNCVESPWAPDQRHVSRQAVERVMELFEAMFVKN